MTMLHIITLFFIDYRCEKQIPPDMLVVAFYSCLHNNRKLNTAMWTEKTVVAYEEQP